MTIGIFGIIGNLSTFVVFLRQRFLKTFHILMMSLAAFDLLLITTCILIFCIPQFSETYRKSEYFNYSFPYVIPIAQIAMTGSIYFTMALTIERYVSVCHPFYRLAHPWPAKNIVLPIVAFSIIYNIPKFFEYETTCKIPIKGTEEFWYKWDKTNLKKNWHYTHIYIIWLNLLLLSLGPVIILIVLNALMLRELIKASQIDAITVGPSVVIAGIQNAPNNRRKEVILAKVSMAIVFVFIICHAFKWVTNIDYMLHSELGFEHASHIQVVGFISHLSLVFNSSINFYIFFAKHWRTILNLPESRASNQTEMTRLQKSSVVTHKNSQITQTQQLSLDVPDDPNQTLLSPSVESK